MRARDITKLTNFHNELNPELWQNNNLKREVEFKLLQIAKAFIEFIDIPNLKLEDITISGSNCSYNYNDQSDIDLHLIVDSDHPCWDALNALFMAKKSLFNDQHDIKIRGNAVEVYVQDAKQPHISNGIYSVVRDKWIKQPEKITATPDKTNVLHKYEFLKHEIEQAIASDDPTAIVKTQTRIKELRKAGLAKSGEFGPENLAFKMLRNDGLIQKLYDAETVAQDKRLSIPEAGASAEDLKLINSAIDFIQNNTKIKQVDDAEAKAQEIINQIGDSKLKRKAKEIFFSAKDNPYVQGGLITTLGSIIANGVIATGQKYGLTPTQTNVMLQLVINSVLPAIYNRMAGKNWKDTIKATFASAMVGASSAAGLGMMEEEQLPNNVWNFINSLAPDDVGHDDVGEYRIHYEGFTDWCQTAAQERCMLPKDDPHYLERYEDIYDEVLRDFISRENGAKPVATGLTGSEEYPIVYAVFKKKDNLNEAISGKDMLKIFRKMHWDKKGRNPEMDQYIMSQEWGIRMIQPSEIPSEEDLYDIDDPFGRIIEIDPDAVRAHARDLKSGSNAPIIMGPNNSIIDGNHRAQAAKAMNKPIQAYVPMGSIDENFADGKVKGKSRPGRVKKAGASCKGSVTDLRAKAKKYGGEKGKMYHWCANMKSGRKKS